jgi:hypothetical protein
MPWLLFTSPGTTLFGPKSLSSEIKTTWGQSGTRARQRFSEHLILSNRIIRLYEKQKILEEESRTAANTSGGNTVAAVSLSNTARQTLIGLTVYGKPSLVKEIVRKRQGRFDTCATLRHLRLPAFMRRFPSPGWRPTPRLWFLHHFLRAGLYPAPEIGICDSHSIKVPSLRVRKAISNVDLA